MINAGPQGPKKGKCFFKVCQVQGSKGLDALVGTLQLMQTTELSLCNYTRCRMSAPWYKPFHILDISTGKVKNKRNLNCAPFVLHKSLYASAFTKLLCCLHFLTTSLAAYISFFPSGVSPSLLTGSSPLHLRSGL